MRSIIKTQETQRIRLFTIGVSNEFVVTKPNQTLTTKPDSQDKVLMRKGGIEMDLLKRISQDTLLAVLRGLGKC